MRVGTPSACAHPMAWNVGAFVLVVGVFGSALAACATEDSSRSVDEANLEPVGGTPPNLQTVFAQAKACTNVLKARAGFRDIDLAQGVLRWNCGDVNGVTVPDLGQEYCEFHAVLNGRVVDRTVVRPAEDDRVECLFTSVFADAEGGNTSELAERLAKQIASQLRSAESLAPEATVMRVGFNSREAARVLIDDCAELGRTEQLDADRQAACAIAWAASTDPADRADIERACAGVDLSDDRAFAQAAAAGVVVHPDDENERDVAACALVKLAKHGGVGWRNSDPSICARTARATRCGYDFVAIPDGVKGFELKGWTSRDALPVGCRYVQADVGSSIPNATHLVSCTASPEDVDEYNRARKPLQMMCRDKFGTNLALQAPFRAIAKKNPSRQPTDTEAFCAAFAESETAEEPVMAP